MTLGLATSIIGLVQGFLPPGGRLLTHGPTGRPYVLTADLNGDGLREIVSVYEVYGEHHLLILAYTGQIWLAAADIKEWPARSAGSGFWQLHRMGEGARGTDLPLQVRTSVNLYPVPVKTAQGTKWGYIDGRGRMAIAPFYDYAFDFQENGLAIVGIGGRSGIIDRSGRYRVQPVYESISPFSEGRAPVIDREGFKVMDERGRILTPKAYSYIGPYRDGRAMVSGQDGKYGYLDLQGREAIPLRYEEAGDFKDGKAVVKVKDGEYALIGQNGQRLQTYPFAYVGGVGDGLLPFQQETGGLYGYIDVKGRTAIKPQYTGAQPFKEGRAVVNAAPDYGNRYGLIDTKGKLLLKPEYNDVRQLGDKRIAVGYAINPEQPFLGSKYAIADDLGHFLTEPKYDQAGDYAKGYASVTDGSSTFFIDRNGKPEVGLPAVSGTGTLSFVGSLIKADVDRRISYYSAGGAPVWQPETVIALRPPYRVKELKYKPNKDYLVYYPEVEGIQDPAVAKKVNDKLSQLSGVKPVGGGQLDYSYTGDFSVAFVQKDLLVLELSGYNFPFGAAHGMPTKVYAHVDLTSGEFYALKDLFKPGSDYVKTLSAIVSEQIKNDPQYDYVFPGSYKGIGPDQPFYVDENALHLYFAPYEIAPYAAGFPTFKIAYADIMDIIGPDRPFWRSYHK